MKLVEEQSLERHEHILATVRQCIVEKGVIDLTIRDLAESCRVSVPTLYRRFGSKEQLLVEAIRSFFDAEVIGGQLENANLSGADRLLAIIDLCGKTIADMPEYNQQLFTLFMSSDYGARLGWDITESITLYVRQGLVEIEQAGELQAWVDVDVLAERVAAQCIISALEFCNGDISTEGFASVFGYSVALLMLATTIGDTSSTFEARVLQTQGGVRRQANPRLQRTPGKIGE
ncbi:MAG: AcrR family transcriptional regulator [Halioglobus sp.]|jgi:AcrR family transcriptional regulator